MSVGMLLRSEYLKTRKRFAFLVTMMFFTGIALIGSIAAWDSSRKAFAKVGAYTYKLPEAWAEILGDPAQMSVFFAAIVLVLLISQEFPWRTARQNVSRGSVNLLMTPPPSRPRLSSRQRLSRPPGGGW